MHEAAPSWHEMTRTITSGSSSSSLSRLEELRHCAMVHLLLRETCAWRGARGQMTVMSGPAGHDVDRR